MSKVPCLEPCSANLLVHSLPVIIESLPETTCTGDKGFEFGWISAPKAFAVEIPARLELFPSAKNMINECFGILRNPILPHIGRLQGTHILLGYLFSLYQI